MKYVHINPAELRGDIIVPASKSICHRAIICSSLCDGISNIENVDFSKDIEATCGALKNLGAEIQRDKNSLIVKGNSQLHVKNSNINCFQSGSTMRFLIPIVATIGEKAIFTGEGRLVERPLDIYYSIFDDQKIYYRNSQGKLPLTLKGKLKPGEYRVKGNVSSQFITGLLFALPLLNEDSTIYITTELESKPYVDITLSMIEKFGISVDENNRGNYEIKGNQKYKSTNFKVEGDFSQAAFWLVMGSLGNGITCHGLKRDSLQGDKIIIDILARMGVEIKWGENSVTVDPSHEIYGTTIDASQCPDLIPILAALASVSCGTTEIKNAGRLRIKESDRLGAISSELNKIGGDVIEKRDGLIIRGRKKLMGGNASSWKDHRIAMALAAISSKCLNPMVIEGAECVKKSYPNFWKDFRTLGGNINEWNMG